MTILQIIVNALIRKNEFQADKFAWSKGRGQKLQDALTLLFKKDKGDVCPDSLYSLALHTHPGLAQRLQQIDNLDKQSKKTD